MSDLISRSALLEKFQYRVPSNDNTANMLNALADTITQIIKDAPAVDAVPVVRCRECKWLKPYQKPVEDFDGRCVVHMCETDDEEFCSIGRRKDDGTDD